MDGLMDFLLVRLRYMCAKHKVLVGKRINTGGSMI